MVLVYYNPTTPSQRSLALVKKNNLWKGKSEKKLTTPNNSKGGRNNLGRITVVGRSRGAKRKYRIIDWKRDKGGAAIVERVEYDPNRSANILLLKYQEDDELRYIIAPEGVVIGDILYSSDKAEIKVGNSLPLKNIPVGTIVHNVELKPLKGAQIARSAGTSATLVSKGESNSSIRLRSGEIRSVNFNCKATIGVVGNQDVKNIKFGKAGRKRWLGFKPKVRGVAMNPVDHPHGGGEGKSSGGRHPVSAWGKPTKGYKTRNNKMTDKYIIRSRHKNKK